MDEFSIQKSRSNFAENIEEQTRKKVFQIIEEFSAVKNARHPQLASFSGKLEVVPSLTAPPLPNRRWESSFVHALATCLLKSFSLTDPASF